MTAAQVLKALMQFAPEVIGKVREFAGVHGIDLGPAPPDLKAHAAEDDAAFDAALAAKRRSE